MAAQHLWFIDPADLLWKDVDPRDSSGKGLMVYVGGVWKKVQRVYRYAAGAGWALGWERYVAPTFPSALVITPTFDSLDEAIPGTIDISWSANSAHEYSTWKVERRQNSGAWNLVDQGGGYIASVALTAKTRYASGTTGFRLSVFRTQDQSLEVSATATATTADKSIATAFP